MMSTCIWMISYETEWAAKRWHVGELPICKLKQAMAHKYVRRLTLHTQNALVFLRPLLTSAGNLVFCRPQMLDGG